ncbi:hypothetical protein BHM03_00051938, partial [Ensete ventricosum]
RCGSLVLSVPPHVGERVPREARSRVGKGIGGTEANGGPTATAPGPSDLSPPLVTSHSDSRMKITLQ